MAELTENDLEKQRRAKGQAEMELNMPILKAAFAEAARLLREQRLQVRARDVEMHTELIRREQTLEKLKEYFLETIATGEAAVKELEYRKSLKERIAEFTGVSRL